MGSFRSNEFFNDGSDYPNYRPASPLYIYMYLEWNRWYFDTRFLLIYLVFVFQVSRVTREAHNGKNA